MTTAPDPKITDELLSAYIDDAVTADERRIVEMAVAEDPEVAWRLDSLRATIHLLRELPALALPRSFVLTSDQLGQAAAPAVVTGAIATRPAVTPRRTTAPAPSRVFLPRLMARWQNFWRGGSPALRNAMAASMALLLVLLLTPNFVTPGGLTTLSAPAAHVATQSLEQARPATGAAAAALPELAAPGADAADLASPTSESRPTSTSAPTIAPALALAAPTEEALAAKDVVPQGAAAELPAEEHVSQAYSEAAPVAALSAAAPAPDTLSALPDSMAAAAPAEPATGAVNGGAGVTDQSLNSVALPPSASSRTTVTGAGAPELFAAAVPAAAAAQPVPPMLAAAPALPDPSVVSREPSSANAPIMPKAVTAGPAAETTIVAPATRAPTAVVSTALPATVLPPTTLPLAADTSSTLAPPATEAIVAVAPQVAAEVPPVAPAPTATPSLPWLVLAQWGVTLITLTFGLLWWRSRRR